MWFGTETGINRYDGYTITTYRHSPTDSNTLSDNYVWALLVDGEGSLWVGTNTGGLNRFDTRTGAAVRYLAQPDDTTQLSSNTVFSLFEARDRSLWVGTHGGLHRFDRATGTFTRFQHDPRDPSTLSHNRVNAIVEDRDGFIWVATMGGLNRLDPRTRRVRRFLHDPVDGCTIPDDRVTDVSVAADGGLWVASWGGVSRIDPASTCFLHDRARPGDPYALPDPLSLRLLHDRTGTLWVGTAKGLARRSAATGAYASYSYNPQQHRGLSADEVNALYQDPSGIIWVATYGGGLTFFHPDFRYRHYTHSPSALRQDGLPNNRIRRITTDRRGQVWLTTDAGLSRFDPNTHAFTSYDLRPSNDASPYYNAVERISEGVDGAFWLGTYQGVVAFDPEKGRPIAYYRHDPDQSQSLSSNRISAVVQDDTGVWWIGTLDTGLNTKAPGETRFRRYKVETSETHQHHQDTLAIKDALVRDLYKDRYGNLWVTTRAGPQAIDLHTRRLVQQEVCHGQLPSGILKDVQFVREDRAGNYWLGTLNNGVYTCGNTARTMRHYTQADGLPSLKIKQISEGQHGLLVLTDRALVRRLPDEDRFVSYKLDDTIQGYELNAFLVMPDGTILLGGYNGLIVFHPDSLRSSTQVAPVVLTDVRAMDLRVVQETPVSDTTFIVRPHNQNRISFDFAILDYTDPASNQYRYWLEGVDPGWVYAGPEHSITYANLKPGLYRFRVRGAGANGVWSEKEAGVHLKILKPYWQTWWFRSLMALLAVGLLTAAYQYRIYHLKREERTRQRIADDLHDDIGSKMSSIALDIEMAGRLLALDGEKLEQLDAVAGTARAVVDDLRDTVWIVDAEHDNLGDLITRMKQVTGALVQGHRYRFYKPESMPEVPLKMEQRRHLFLFFKEALHNVARHAEAAYVEVRVVYEAGRLTIEVQDDGIGFDPETIGRGRGLTTMRKRVEKELGGTLMIESAPGQGATVRLTVKIA